MAWIARRSAVKPTGTRRAQGGRLGSDVEPREIGAVKNQFVASADRANGNMPGPSTKPSGKSVDSGKEKSTVAQSGPTRAWSAFESEPAEQTMATATPYRQCGAPN